VGSWRLPLISIGGVLALVNACGGKSAQHVDAGHAGTPAAGAGARGGTNASGGMPASTGGAVSSPDSGEGGAELGGRGGRVGRGGRDPISGAAGAAGLPAGGAVATGGEGGEGGPVAVGGDGGAIGGQVGEAGTGGSLECGDCSLPGEMCVVGVCDFELGRCARAPVIACQSGDGCCPPGCAADDDADCTSFRVVLAPSYSGNRSEDGALGATTFTGVMEQQHFHAFFVFDLSGIEGTVASAELDLYYDEYLSTDAVEHFFVRTVAAPTEALLDTAARTDVFDALQSGSYCFDTAMTSEHVGSTVAFGLNDDTLAELTATLGSSMAFGIVADATPGDLSSVEGIRFSDGVTPPLERLTLIVEP